MSNDQPTQQPRPVVFVVDEAHALLGGMTGQGKSTAMRKAVADLLERARDTGMPIVISDSKGTKDWLPQS